MIVPLRPSAFRCVLRLAAIGLIACDDERQGASADLDTSRAGSAAERPAPADVEPEPKQWTVREVAKRLTDGGLVVTDSGTTRIRHSFLAVEGHHMRVSGSDLQVFIYPDPQARRADSERIDSARVAPATMIIDWVATPHLIASGNLIAIHLPPNERLAERVRLILEAWHSAP